MGDIAMTEFNPLDEQFKFRQVNLGLLDVVLCNLFVGRQTLRNNWKADNNCIGLGILMVILGAGMFGIGKLFCALPFLTLIGIMFTVVACVITPHFQFNDTYIPPFITLVIGSIGYLLPFTQLTIFSFNLFPYCMLVLIASSLLALLRRVWNQMIWAIIDYLYRKYDVEPVDEVLLNEWYENRDARESAQNNE